MDVHSLDYARRAAAILRDSPSVRESVTGAALHFDANRAAAYHEIDSDAWRTWAAGVKSHALTHLDRYLEQATTSLTANGVRVHWAATADDACETLIDIARESGVRRIVKGKSMLSEELGINERLENHGAEVFETDLGEYIIQLLDEPPSHILGPAIHRSLDDIRALFHDRFGTARDASPETLAARARERLRDAFLTADMGITGANFVAADTGTIALIENEGNIRLSTSLPRIHVALVGIEKVVPRYRDLAHLLQLAARAATGQRIGTFVSLIQGPGNSPASQADTSQPVEPTRHGSETDGPEQVHVIFVDNGRSGVLADPVVWEALRCIRCGACLNTCPVYRQTGGHAYGWVYSGPIGAILAPGLLGLERTHPLPFASSLCGACADVCPVRIDIPTILLEWRARAVRAGYSPDDEARAMSWFATLATRPAAFRAAGAALRAAPRRLRDSLPVLRGWNESHASVEPSKRSFASLWKRERNRPVEAIEAAPASTGAGEHAERDVDERTDRVAGAAGAAGDTAGQPADVTDSSAPTGPRRAFASGSLRPVSRTRDDRPATDNSVTRAVSRALEGRTRIAHPGALQPAGNRNADEAGRSPVDSFMDRFTANGGEVVRFASASDASAWLGDLADEFETCDVGVFVPEHLSPSAAGLRTVPPADAALGVSSAISAAADTGTVLLDSRDGRATQLLPPTHLVWLREGNVHATLTDALAEAEAGLPAAIGLHSGPSRSADIGRVLVTGVHGPGRVIVALIP